jgi:hypothetical protein
LFLYLKSSPPIRGEGANPVETSATRRDDVGALYGGFVKQLVYSVAGIAALVASTAAFATPNAATTARLVSVTSPVARNELATLVAHVVPARRCTIKVLYKSGPSQAAGLNPKRPVHGHVSWTWKVGGNTTLGRWPITVKCGTTGSLRTHFTVIH